MEKRVTFKNASSQTNKRARLTHEDGVAVDVGNQTGAVYYEQPEIGMCYSKPMEITATVNEETQCVSLVGLYDLFIDGQRIGRGMTQEEIVQRVNAGDYGVEVNPCLTVSCDGAASKTNCLTLTGTWDVEINDVRVLENADEKRILAALRRNPLIRTENCRPLCVSEGEIVFNINDLPPDLTFDVGSVVVLTLKLTDLNNSDIVEYVIIEVAFREEAVYIEGGSWSTQISYRNSTTDPWDGSHLILALSKMSIPGFFTEKTPDDYESGSLNYCKDGLINYESHIAFQNTYALSRETYYYSGGYGLNLGSLTTPIVHMSLDGVELTPYTWSPIGEERTVIERAALEHFKVQLEARGITCEIIDDVRTNIPPAYNGGGVTSTLALVLNATYRFSITTSKQWEGTANHPELNNARNGWAESSIGLTAFGQGFSSTGFASSNGCALGAATPEEVNLTAKIKGYSEGGPLTPFATFILKPMSLEFVSLVDEGIPLRPEQIDFMTIYPALAAREPLLSCGIVEMQDAPEM